jgi:hypothetical protein
MVIVNVSGGKVESWEVTKLSMEALHSMLQGLRVKNVNPLTPNDL